jgi:hypothetical protein
MIQRIQCSVYAGCADTRHALHHTTTMATGEPDSPAAYKHFHTPPGEGTSMQVPVASPHVRAPVAASIRKHFKNDDSWMSHHTPCTALRPRAHAPSDSAVTTQAWGCSHSAYAICRPRARPNIGGRRLASTCAPTTSQPPTPPAAAASEGGSTQKPRGTLPPMGTKASSFSWAGSTTCSSEPPALLDRISVWSG